MWRIPLQPQISNNNTDTLLLNGPTGTESLNTTYTVPKSAQIIQHMQTNCDNLPALDEAIHNVYELPITETKIRYLHGAAGFPTKATWLKDTRKVNYQSCPLVNSKNVNNIFPESEETQKGHMSGKHQVEHSTKEKATTPEAAATQQSTNQTNSGGSFQQDHFHVPFDKKKDIFIAVYKPRDTIYTYQTGKLLHTSSRGHNYQMVIHKIDGDSTWIELMNKKDTGGND